jgi:hypothetical protein
MFRLRTAALAALLACACSSPPGAPAGAGAAPAVATTSAEAKALFARPTREFATAPLWVWNDNLTDAQITGTLRDLAGQGVKQVFVHPRPGLMTPYLSAEWFRLWKLALAEAETLDMNVWIYDENSYPSGFAGGFVPDAMPESRGRGLSLKDATEPPADALAVYTLTEAGYEDVSTKAKAGGLPTGKYLVATVLRAKDSPWHGGKCYVDLLYPGVTEKFLEITLDAYRREVGDQFGKRIPGIFTDEPELIPAGGLPWTDDLPAQFEKRWGYSLMAHLPALTKPLGDWKQVRHDYYRLLLELFIARWGKPYYEACEKAGIAFTGHYWEHGWPSCGGVPDNMAMSAWQQIPGIDCLMNQYKEDVRAQFGNVRSVREVASLANQLGRTRVLCEAYGAGGWDLRFEDMKRIADWLLVLGVNLIDEHLSYVTLRGARKRDHPQSFSYHEPWWHAYHVRAAYDTRLCAALTRGEQVNPILVLEPTPTAWMLQGTPELKPLGDRFQALLLALERAQVEYDLGCEDTMSLHGSASGGALTVGRRSYRTVVVPPMTETVYGRTMDFLESVAKGGGTVLCCGDPPARVDGRPSARGAALAKAPGWKRVEAEALPGILAGAAGDGFAIRRAADDKGILFHHRRRLADGEILFLVNTSITDPSAGTVASPMKGIERWDPYTGKIEAESFQATAAGVELAFELPPCGSRLVFLSKEKRVPAPAVAEKVTVLQPASGPGIGMCRSSNVLPLDFVDVEAGGEAKKGVYYYAANQFVFKKNGMDRNPWDSAVQFKDQLVTKTFPPESGFTVSYRFSIAEKVPNGLQAVVERPDLYAIELNGKPVTPAPGASWLDKAFGVLYLEKVAQVGENVLTLKASPFTIYHEIEPVFIRGFFQLQATESGFVINPGTKQELGPWSTQGYPFYGHGMYYHESFQVDKPQGRYRLSVPEWYGSTAMVWVNGKEAGFLDSAPWEVDVTPMIKAGANDAVVVVYGTLKNTLGPFHNGPGLGTAWPGMFQKGPASGPPPGEKYATVKYGLFKPFVLKQITTE